MPAKTRRGRRRFLRFILNRILAFVGLIFGITLVLFVLARVAALDPTAAALGDEASLDPEAVAAFRAKFGLDRSLPERYFLYLWSLLQGDLGMSTRTHQAVASDLLKAIPASMELATVAVLITIVGGIGLGVIAGTRRNSVTDQVIRLLSLGGISMPIFYLGILTLFLFFYLIPIFPSGGRLGPREALPSTVTGLMTVDSLLAGDLALFRSALMHLILPAFVLASGAVGVVTRFCRASILEVLQADYVIAARAKGLPEGQVIVRYVLRAGLVPVVTLLGVVFAGLLSGAVLTETIFSWPGVGQYAFLSASNLDINGVIGVTLFIGLVYTVVNLGVDLLYGVIDPRIREG